MTRTQNRQKAIRTGFYAFSIVAWSVAAFLVLEISERWRWRRIQAKNDIVIDARVRRAELTQAFSESLWDEPWFSYKSSQAVSSTIDGNHFQIKINNVGLRDDAVLLEKPQTVFRILCIGGSTTVEGWTNDTTYPNILEKRLRKAFPHIPLEVINGGISGLNSFSELKKMPDYLSLKPDLIIRYNAVNDICWRYFPYLRSTTCGWRRILSKSAFVTRHLNRFLLPGDGKISAYFQKTTIKNLSALHAEARKRNIPVMFCSFSRPHKPMLGRKERAALEYDLKNIWQSGFVNFESYCRLVDIYNQSLKIFCRQNNIPYIPVAENMQGGFDLFLDICHATPEGIEKKTSLIYAYLKPLLRNYLPPQPRR